jgi:2-keto-4-pentenoate hydratase/2-oxohepta-3-ene-1,7-dioic acid hydratase in catechol pathway
MLSPPAQHAAAASAHFSLECVPAEFSLNPPFSPSMKIIRYLDSPGRVAYGWLGDDGRPYKISGDPFAEFSRSAEAADVAKLLAPVAPTGFFCVGLNYRKHAAETNAKIPERPILFMKGINAVQNPGDPIQIPAALASAEVDYECELAIVIARPCKNVRRADALDFVLGYCCANDVSARDWQIKWGGSQWCRGKTFDTFAPLGPCLVTPDEIPNPNDLAIRTILNGEIVQDSRTNDMIFDVPAVIEFLSGSTTLMPGTVILTGTPSGVGMARKPPVWFAPGDEVTVEIEGIGKLTNPVEIEPLPAD